MVAICPGRGKHAIGRATVVGVSREPLGLMTRREARREGFATIPAFRAAWVEINGSYDPAAIVWRLELRPVPAVAAG